MVRMPAMGEFWPNSQRAFIRRERMNIQWYPGHMTKARRMMQENIKLIDLIIELVDARAPLSSRNPDIDELGKGKARLIRQIWPVIAPMMHGQHISARKAAS